jgi:hypothetical protein
LIDYRNHGVILIELRLQYKICPDARDPYQENDAQEYFDFCLHSFLKGLRFSGVIFG